MFYINKRNLYIRVAVAIFIIAGIGLAFMGGIDFVNAQMTDSSELPEGYTATDPFTDESVQVHMSATAMNKNYSVHYSEVVQTNNQLVTDKDVITAVSNTDTVGYQLEESMDMKREVYETENTLYIKENGDVKTNQKEGDDYQSPILENQFKNANTGLNSFAVFNWSLQSVEDGTATYTLSRADAMRVPGLYTIDSAEGTLKVNVEKGYIKKATVYITGMSKDNPTELTTVSYSYTVSTSDDVVQEPVWVPESNPN